MGLVSLAAGINDEVKLGAGDFEIAEQDAGVDEAEQAAADAEMIDARIGRLAGSFKAVNDQAVDIGLEVEQMPVEGADFNSSAG